MAHTVHYYDLVLAAIAASLAAGVALGALTRIDLTVTVPALGIVAVALIGHALFVNGPVDDVEDLADPVEPDEVPGGRAVAAVVAE